jgi:methyl coenzyme M reductase subunit C
MNKNWEIFMDGFWSGLILSTLVLGALATGAAVFLLVDLIFGLAAACIATSVLVLSVASGVAALIDSEDDDENGVQL